MSLQPPQQPTTCPPIEGNGELYGIGVRIGVYLQWVSSWFELAVDASLAQDIQDANSVFLFAIIIATALAARRRILLPVDGYIMLQFAVGFIVTIFHIVGARARLMAPARTASLVHAAKVLPRPVSQAMKEKHFFSGGKVSGNLSHQKSTCSVEEGREAALRDGSAMDTPKPEGNNIPTAKESPVRNRGTVFHRIPSFFNYHAIKKPMVFLSFLKLPVLSWSGVLWRAIITGMVMAFNVWYWFHGIEALTPTELVDQPCSTQIFLFARLEVRGRVLQFFRVASIITLVPTVFLVVYLGLIATRLVVFIAVCIIREIGMQVHKVETEIEEMGRVQNTLQRLDHLIRPIQHIALVGRHAVGASGTVFAPEFWATPLAQIPRFTDLMKLLAVLTSGTISRDPIQTVPHVERKYFISSALYNLLILALIAWFTVSIELAIRWNHVEGVNDLDSTGQLIALVVGIVSFLHACKATSIAFVKSMYPDWAQTKLKISDNLIGKPRIVVASPEDLGVTQNPIS